MEEHKPTHKNLQKSAAQSSKLRIFLREKKAHTHTHPPFCFRGENGYTGGSAKDQRLLLGTSCGFGSEKKIMMIKDGQRHPVDVFFGNVGEEATFHT